MHYIYERERTFCIHSLFVSAAEIGFIVTDYSVSESESLVEVCVGITNGQTLDHGYGSATLTIMTMSTTATG